MFFIGSRRSYQVVFTPSPALPNNLRHARRHVLPSFAGLTNASCRYHAYSLRLVFNYAIFIIFDIA